MLDIAYNAGDPGLIPESGRSPGEGKGNHPSILAWEIHGQRSLAAIVHGVTRVGHHLVTNPQNVYSVLFGPRNRIYLLITAYRR